MKLFLILLIFFCIASSKKHFKGVSKEDQKKYSKGVTCEDGTKIPPKKINDNFCDCPESGIDEPGTSACSSSAITEPTFYCENRGYLPEKIFPSRVGDGRCDCCDGSDEPEGTCPNTCKEAGKDILLQYQKELRTFEKALEKRRSYIKYGTDELVKKQKELDDMKKQIEILEPALRAQRKEKERMEDIEEIERKAWKYERRKEKVKGEIKKTEKELDDVLGDDDPFFEEDEDLKKLNDDQYLEESGKDELVHGIKRMRRKMKIQTLLLKKKEDKIEDLKDTIRDSNKASTLTPDGESKKDDDDDDDGGEVYVNAEAESARERYNELKIRVDDLNNDIRDLEELLDEDYGPNNEFYILREKCFSKRVKKKYSYELCPYSTAQQKDDKSETNLGKWTSFNKMDKSERFKKFKFENGLSCWKGPARSLTVVLACGSDELVTKMEEPSMCVYEGIFETPAACSESALEEIHSKLDQLQK